MTFLEICRNKAFWFMDKVKGKKVSNYLSLLEMYEGGSKTAEEVEEFQQKELEKLLRHCKESVPFYSSIESFSLTDLPIINKSTIRNDYSAFRSKKYSDNELIQMSTSGSTGTPFKSLQNVEKKKSVNAETLFYNGKTGFKIGRRIIYLRSVVAETQKTIIQQFAQNIYLLDCTDLSDKGIEEKLKFIKKYSKHCGAMMMGYSSTLDAFRMYFERHGYEKANGCKLYGIIGGSTMLYDETRTAMEKAFNCRCYSRYANEENGFLGQDDKDNNVFLMNRVNYITEVLKMDSNEPAAINEIGRIVITDLRNYAMPMIRYDTGDVGSWVKLSNDEKVGIGNFGGRSIDMIFNVNNEPVSPHSVSTAMWEFKAIKQYQFAQTGIAEYEIRLNADESEVNTIALLSALENVVGEGSNIKVSYLNEIPVLSSGKRRYIINEMN